MDTVTVLEDIPYGDCFEVEDRWVVRPIRGGATEASGSVELTCTFEIRWIKGTMWKRAIESKTAADMKTFFAKCAEVMAERLAAYHESKARGESLAAPAPAALPVVAAEPPLPRPAAQRSAGDLPVDARAGTVEKSVAPPAPQPLASSLSGL